jgi:general L-amino acid transport system permease protein
MDQGRPAIRAAIPLNATLTDRPRPGRSLSRPARAWAWQVVAVLVFVALVLWLGNNARVNMQLRNITFGFDFLWHTAGFDIPFHLLSWENTDTYGYALLVCIVNSMLCAAMSIVLASMLGLLIALMRLSGNPLAAGIARGVMEIVRNTPQLLQIFFIYVAVLQSLPPPRNSIVFGAGFFLNVRGMLIPSPTLDSRMVLLGGVLLGLVVVSWFARPPGSLAGVVLGPVLIVAWLIGAAFAATWEMPALHGFNFTGGLRIPPELLALWLGISIYTSAFISEIVRAAILGIQHGQTEAALSLGLSRGLTMYLVILPQALRTLIPPLTSQYLNIIKSTTLGAAIAYPDVLQIFGRTVLNQSGRAVEVMTLLMSVFLSINLLASAAMNRWNRRLMEQGR